MFQELYFYRWPIELKYKELKSRLAIEEFSGATTTSVFQEFYINMLLSNLSSLIKNQANRAFIIGFMKRLLPKILCTISTIDEINRLYSEAVRNRSQIMPGVLSNEKRIKQRDEHTLTIKKFLFDWNKIILINRTFTESLLKCVIFWIALFFNFYLITLSCINLRLVP